MAGTLMVRRGGMEGVDQARGRAEQNVAQRCGATGALPRRLRHSRLPRQLSRVSRRRCRRFSSETPPSRVRRRLHPRSCARIHRPDVFNFPTVLLSVTAPPSRRTPFPVSITASLKDDLSLTRPFSRTCNIRPSQSGSATRSQFHNGMGTSFSSPGTIPPTFPTESPTSKISLLRIPLSQRRSSSLPGPPPRPLTPISTPAPISLVASAPSTSTSTSVATVRLYTTGTLTSVVITDKQHYNNSKTF